MKDGRHRFDLRTTDARRESAGRPLDHQHETAQEAHGGGDGALPPRELAGGGRFPFRRGGPPPPETGEEACALLRIEGKSITLALLDIELPGMGGKQTFRRMRKIRPELPVMVSTGHGIVRQISAIPEPGPADLRLACAVP